MASQRLDGKKSANTTANFVLGDGSAAYSFNVNPENINWDYTITTNEQDTYGGKVVQILGIKIGNMSISGKLPWNATVADKQTASTVKNLKGSPVKHGDMDGGNPSRKGKFTTTHRHNELDKFERFIINAMRYQTTHQGDRDNRFIELQIPAISMYFEKFGGADYLKTDARLTDPNLMAMGANSTFKVFIKSFPTITRNITTGVPTYNIQLEVIEGGHILESIVGADAVKLVQANGLSGIYTGVGWKKSIYNDLELASAIGQTDGGDASKSNASSFQSKSPSQTRADAPKTTDTVKTKNVWGGFYDAIPAGTNAMARG